MLSAKHTHLHPSEPHCHVPLLPDLSPSRVDWCSFLSAVGSVSMLPSRYSQPPPPPGSPVKCRRCLPQGLVMSWPPGLPREPGLCSPFFCTSLPSSSPHPQPQSPRPRFFAPHPRKPHGILVWHSRPLDLGWQRFINQVPVVVVVAVRAGEDGSILSKRSSSTGIPHTRLLQVVPGFRRAWDTRAAASSLVRFPPTRVRLVGPAPRGVTNGLRGLSLVCCQAKVQQASRRIGE